MRPVVGSELLAGLSIADDPLLLAEPGREEIAGAPVGDEADVVAVGLLGDQQSAVERLGAHGLLMVVAQRKHRALELRGLEHREHVGLILGRVCRAVKFDTGRTVGQARVVAGGHGVEAKVNRAIEHSGELNVLVAAQAGVGGTARRILGHEVVDDLGLELLGEIPHVERNAQHVSHPACIASVFERAAAPGALSEGLRVGAQSEVDAHDVVPALDGARCGNCRVDSTREGGQYLHRTASETGRMRGRPALRARSTTGVSSLSTVRTSFGVEV
ncbi:unannotated protein [freshwater metagenome]|uniref:Unannotated protein n=1 Tax=freshwater metagenome TaxID=449393 RepID=A0A6J7QAW1_9ZZZZ